MSTQQMIPLSNGDIITIQLDQLGASIGSTVAADLDRAVENAIAQTNFNIQTPEDYKVIADHRDGTLQVLLKGPKAKTPDPERSAKVRLILQIENAAGAKIGIAAEMPLSTRSIDEFYNPLAALLDSAHKGVTGARKALTDRLTKCIQAVGPAQLKWKDLQEKLDRERKERERLAEEQRQRTHEAGHWLSQLELHGQNRQDYLSLLPPIDQVKAEHVAGLKQQLDEVMEEEAIQKELQQLRDSVKFAASCGHPEVGLDNAVAASHPEVAEEVLGTEQVQAIKDERKRKTEEEERERQRQEKERERFAEEARIRNLPPPPAPAPAPKIEILQMSAPAPRRFTPPPAPAPPPRPMAPAATITQTATPKVEGEGIVYSYILKITNPRVIPSDFCRPPEKQEWNPDAYPRLQNMANDMKMELVKVCPGIEVIEERSVRGRRK